MFTESITVAMNARDGKSTPRNPTRPSSAPFSLGEEVSATAVRTSTPRRGNSGISQRGIIIELPPHIGIVIGIHRFLIAEQQNHDREAHAGFGGGDTDCEKRNDLARDARGGGKRLRETDEAQIHGVERKFDAHQHEEHVAAGKRCRESDREENQGEDLNVNSLHISEPPRSQNFQANRVFSLRAPPREPSRRGAEVRALRKSGSSPRSPWKYRTGLRT